MVLCLLIGVGIFAILIHYYNSIRFDLDQVVHYTPPLTTQIVDRKGRLVANLYDKEFRFYAPFDDFPARVIEALAAVEDTLFFEHPGVNIDAISRAMVKNLASGKMLEGGSTITQQLIKNIVLTPERTFDRKIKEALLAIRIEQVLSKEEILERYLNRAYFGHGYYGIRTAALGYFRKDLDRLTLKESALLAGLVRAPAFYDPTKNLDFALGRANNILQRMYALGWITDDELQRGIDEVPKIHNDTLSANVAPYVVNEVLRQLPQLQDIKTGGYVIKLNLDLDYQEAAQEALVYGYEQIRKRQPNYDSESLNGAIVVLENRSGRIRAMVGGVDYKKSNFNRVTQAKRQPGSSFKPFIYQAALDYSYSESDLLADIARTYEYYSNGERRVWQPKNYSNAFKGLVTLKTALEQSLNLATINLVEDVGFERIWQ
ncbi:MAG: penicillin-binding protein, partial [Helicobacter sp.]|nr:penicillin-binding protein [Helicobacter sp.]